MTAVMPWLIMELIDLLTASWNFLTSSALESLLVIVNNNIHYLVILDVDVCWGNMRTLYKVYEKGNEKIIFIQEQLKSMLLLS